MNSDPYGHNILAHDPHRDGRGRRPRSQAVHVEIGMVLEDVAGRCRDARGKVWRCSPRGTGGSARVIGPSPSAPVFGWRVVPVRRCASALSGASSGTQVVRQDVTSRTPVRCAHSGGPKVCQALAHLGGGRRLTPSSCSTCGARTNRAGIAVQLLRSVDNLEVLDIFGPTDYGARGCSRRSLMISHCRGRIPARWPGAVLVLGHRFRRHLAGRPSRPV